MQVNSSAFEHYPQCPETKRKKTRLVVFTCCASLTSFFAAGFYEYVRPKALFIFVGFAEDALIWAKNKVASHGSSLGFTLPSALNDLVCESPPKVRILVRAGLEASILVPALLLILPFTHRKWQELRSTSQGKCKNRQKENELCSLLRVVSWMLWTLSAVGLMLGIAIGSQRFGVISVSALMTFFAQAVWCVGYLLSSSVHDEDDILQEACSIDKGTDLKVLASTWTSGAAAGNGQQNETGGKSELFAAFASFPPEEDGAKRKKPRNNSGAVVLPVAPEKVTHAAVNVRPNGDYSNLLLFFFIKIALLQTPYCLQMGLHTIHDCVSCAKQYQIQLDPTYHISFFDAGEEYILPKEIPAAVALVCTILVPLFTHGVGGIIFNGARWSFHHPFDGGRLHVTTQATGWSLVGVAGFLHLAFMLLGMGNKHVYLLHSGSVVSWFAESLLLYSLIDFRPTRLPRRSFHKKSWEAEELGTFRYLDTFLFLCLGYSQDIVATNLHWLTFAIPLAMTLLVLGPPSIPSSGTFGSPTAAKVALCMFLLISSWVMPYVLISYAPRRKKWKWNIFGHFNNFFEWFMCHPRGVYSTQLRMEDNVEDYQRPGAMFCMAPHGTLPTSVAPIFYQLDNVFSDVCVFFGSQADLCPAYRFFFGMRGGFLPVEKKRLVSVMETRQNVALVPGGVSEMLRCIPHDKTINVSIKHKGFIRLAIQNGYDLVPIFFFHANDQYNSPMRKVQMRTHQSFGVPLPPLYCNRWGFPMSNRTPIQVALGRRIAVEKNRNPSTKAIDQLHRQFYEEVLRIWQLHKDEFGFGSRALAYVM